MSYLTSSPLRSTLAFAGTLLLVATLSAQQPAARNYSFTDATGEVLPKYKAAVDAKNYDGAIAILDAQIAKVPADSYDAAMLYQIKTQTLLQKGDFPKAIEPTEKALALSEAKSPTYFEERATRDLYFFLAQLYVQEASQVKNPAAAGPLFAKADKTMQSLLKLTPKPSSDTLLFYSQMLYAWAVLNAEKPNLDIIKRALEQVELGMHLSIRPKDTFYLLKTVCLQQLNRPVEAAEMFELLVKQKPETSTYWQQLAGLYLATGQDLRAVVTIERAQANGHMATPQYNFNVIGIYFNLGQFEKAADLLESGLKSGTIESEQKNWELLALAYQQLQQPHKGIDALQRAAKAFPKAGQLEFMIGQAYYSLEKPDLALPHLQAAVAKGNLLKPHQVYSYLAYIAFELKKFDIALDAAKKAVETPDGAKDKQIQSLYKAIEDVIKDREVKKAKM